MKQLLILVLTLSVVACSKPASRDSVESLVANPERLKELRARCKANHAEVGDVVCAAASEATRRRFMGNGKSPYAGDSEAKPAPKVVLPASSAGKDRVP